jgi:hypothetical protein
MNDLFLGHRLNPRKSRRPSWRAPPRRLVLLFDGTWNRREDTTNIWRMKMLLRQTPDQLVYYDEGVGTAKGMEFKGGALGQGLSRKVLEGYLWLIEHYEDAAESATGQADEIYIFGFSRGAYTARSLVGFLAISGLLKTDAAARIRDAFELSRIAGLHEHHYLAESFRSNHSRNVKVKFLGVWDTVGALGVPEIEGLPSMRSKALAENAEHKVVELPGIVLNARHALAIDERRRIFQPTLWPRSAPPQTMEQRWFIGAHANVGGGYDRDGLFLRPLQWLQDEARIHGLAFRKRILVLSDAFYTSAPRNPLSEIGYGAYYLTQKFRPFDRELGAQADGNETLDYTVMERWLWSPSYTPGPLQAVLGHKPRTRPVRYRMSDFEIRDLLSISPKVSGTRGYHIISPGRFK